MAANPCFGCSGTFVSKGLYEKFIISSPLFTISKQTFLFQEVRLEEERDMLPNQYCSGLKNKKERILNES